MLCISNLRLLWQIIEEFTLVAELNDAQIVQQILEQLQARVCLNSSELSDTQIYLNHRVSLIRDLAEINLLITN